MLEAAAVPIGSAKVVGAVSKALGRPASEALLAELIDSGKLIRVPLFGGAKAKVCSRIIDEAVFRAELEAARLVIEAGYRRLEGRVEQAAPIEEQILDTISALEPHKGLLITASRLYRALAGTARTEIDAALLRLQDARRIILQKHSNPQSADGQDLIAGLYVGACWRVEP